MAKSAKKSTNNLQILESLWGRLGISLVLLVLAYGFASWAIDSGNLLHYAIAIILVYFGLAHFVRGIRRSIAR